MKRLTALLAFSMFAGCSAQAPAPRAPAPGAAPSEARGPDPRDPRARCDRGYTKLFASLKAPVRITAYVSRATPTLDAFARGLTSTIDHLAAISNHQVELTVVEPKTDAERAAAKDAGVREFVYGEGRGADQALIARVLFGIVVRYRDVKEVLPQLSPDQSEGVEYWIADKLMEARDEADGGVRKFGVLANKGEIKLTDANLTAGGEASMRGILDAAYPYNRWQDVDLRRGQAPIDPALSALILTQPAEDYTDEELRRIDEFLMLGGKSVAIFAGAASLEPTGFTLSAHRLERLLGAYGVEMKKELVLDWAAGATVPATARVQSFTDAAIVVGQYDAKAPRDSQRLDDAFVPFLNIQELAFPFSSTLVAHPDRQPEATMSVIARSSPKATVDSSGAPSLSEPKGQVAQRGLAIALEGTLRSAFSDAKSTGPDRLLVVASSQFLANPFVRERALMSSRGTADDASVAAMNDIVMAYARQYLTANILAFKGTLDWMSTDSDTLSCATLRAGAAPALP